MTSDKARKNAIRGRMAATGAPYSVAARALVTPAAAVDTIDPVLLAPYPDEVNVDVDELGWRVLPIDATPAQRAHAEAYWRPVAPERPCRCSGSCLHATDCEFYDHTGQRCTGRLMHVDRYPGSLFSVEVWEDVYRCDDCEAVTTTSVQLPAVPWGEANPAGGITVYDRVRHPSFPSEDTNDGYDPSCFECGARGGYRCTCDDEPWRCDECGGDDSAYGCTC